MQEDVCRQYTNTMAFSVGMDFWTPYRVQGWGKLSLLPACEYPSIPHPCHSLGNCRLHHWREKGACVSLYKLWIHEMRCFYVNIFAQRGGWLSDLLYILCLAGRVGIHPCYPTSAWQVEAGSYWWISSRRVILRVIESENTLFLHTL